MSSGRKKNVALKQETVKVLPVRFPPVCFSLGNTQRKEKNTQKSNSGRKEGGLDGGAYGSCRLPIWRLCAKTWYV